ncbi:adhesion G protein-coupled receptor L2-like isoform X2 [Gigantopelta aegis]|uniref:adhesion G protein-coupled receptor L2-like isoform X2 n=1 Tax=Gigantopelta aegis TaxID=1735272 RepID=UPI001B88AD80|nr:adhesion G protein-coupled receptor L2-like isoform X2 [Gigantopelta aegis]
MTTTPKASTINTKPPSSTPVVSMCETEKDSHGLEWASTPPTSTSTQPCPKQYEGNATRYCSQTSIWGTPSLIRCKNKQLVSLAQTSATQNLDLENSLNNLSNIARNTKLVAGDIDLTIDILKQLVEALKTSNSSQPSNTTEKLLLVIMDTVDYILNAEMKEWLELLKHNMSGAGAAMSLLEKIVMTASTRLKNAMDVDSEGKPINTERTFNGSNVYLVYGRMNSGTIRFPSTSHIDTGDSSWLSDMNTWSELPLVFVDVDPRSTEFVGYGGILYRNISALLPQERNSEAGDSWVGNSASWAINSPVLSLSLEPNLTQRLSKPLIISFQHTQTNLGSPACSYLSYEHFQVNGRWSSAGCSVRNTSDSQTVCECNHLTSFAILMTNMTAAVHRDILSKITMVGCAVSILCLSVTIASYLFLWRYVKSDPAIILINLCTAMIIAHSLFVFGADRTENKTECTVIAVLMHYFFLVGFALMLVEGIDVLLSVITVFKVTSRLFRLLVFGWGSPLLIVGISAGITELKRYGNSRACWLTQENGFLWAFLGPVLAVIVINMIIVVMVLKAMFREKSIGRKTSFEKARTGLRAVCVLVPVMGLTWLFGVFAINNNEEVFQYLFTVFNSFQGLFIFIFHCVLSRQIRTALRTKIRRYQAHRWNSSGSKFFSHTSQRTKQNLTSKRSNASQKIKLDHSQEPSGEFTKVNVNISESTCMPGYKYDLRALDDSGIYSNSNCSEPVTPTAGVINVAFTDSSVDAFYLKQSGLPSTHFKGVKISSVKSKTGDDRQHNSFGNKVSHTVSNLPKCTKLESERKSTPQAYCELSSPVPCQLKPASSRLYQRRALQHHLPRLELSTSTGQRNYYSLPRPSTPPPPFSSPNSTGQRSCQSHSSPSPAPPTFSSPNSIGQRSYQSHSSPSPPTTKFDFTGHSFSHPSSQTPKFVSPGSIGQHACHSPTRPTSPTAEATRHLPSGNVRFMDKGKFASDLEQKVKERMTRLEQIYGAAETIWPKRAHWDNAVTVAKGVHRQHLSHLSTLQHIKARANWQKLKRLLFRSRDSGRYSVDHQWDAAPTLRDLSMHGTFHPFGGIRLPSPTGPHGVFNWSESPFEGSIIHWD